MQSAPVCDFTATIEGVNQEFVVSLDAGGPDVALAEDNVFLDVQRLKRHQDYRINISAANIRGHSVNISNLSEFVAGYGSYKCNYLSHFVLQAHMLL